MTIFLTLWRIPKTLHNFVDKTSRLWNWSLTALNCLQLYLKKKKKKAWHMLVAAAQWWGQQGKRGWCRTEVCSTPPLSFLLISGKAQYVHLVCVIISMLGRSSPWAEGGKEWGTVTCEQAGNDPDSRGSLEQTRHYKGLSPTAILPLSHTDLQYLSLSICPPPPRCCSSYS